jgi:phage shock protein C
MEKKLYRDEHNKMVGGVCAGLAEYFNMDITAMRLIFAFAVFAGGVSVVPYIILWIVVPRKTFGPFTTPSDPSTVDYVVPPVTPPTFSPNQPFTPLPPKRQGNTAGIVIGAIFIFIGAIALMHNYNIFFFWHLRHWFFPTLLVAFGISMIIKGQQKRPWEHTGWHETETKTDAPNQQTSASNTNPPTEL